ncbi:MAG: O-antigen ligase family protein, partial [Oscillospiraceae bacterium]|nr:O-antigen ligase family protein [Oscillospiraceae bacterium]
LYCVYRQYGFAFTTRAIGGAGALYTSVILVAYLTGTSFRSYGNSGYGYNGWFYAANEIGCIIALSAPFTVYHCVKLLPTLTKKTWWKGLVIVWCLVAVVFSANFIGTKIVFYFNLLYALAALVWMLIHLYRERSGAVLLQVAALLVVAVAIMGIYRISALRQHQIDVVDPIADLTSEEVSGIWVSEIATDSEGTWLRQAIADVPTLQWIDAKLSRRLFTAAPSVQVYIEGGVLTKLLGVGYANTKAYNWDPTYMVEMDPLAVLIRHGAAGFVVYCLPYFAFILYAVVEFFKHPLRRLSSLSYCTLLYCTLAGCAIASIAGHALVSPAVSTFVLAVGMQFWIRTQEQNRQIEGEQA